MRMMEKAMYEKLERAVAEVYAPAEYPALRWQTEMWSAGRPLEGVELLDATPVYRNTMAKYLALLAAGAHLTIGLSRVMAHDRRIVRFLREAGLEVCMAEESPRRSFDVILDCAASFAAWEARSGYVELTRSGVERYAQSGRPVYMADSGQIKQIETLLGTGESFFRAMAALGYAEWNGRKLVVFGSGKVGSGILLYAHRRGAIVTVVTDPRTLSERFVPMVDRVVDFRDRTAVEEVLRSADAVVTATGVVGAVQHCCAPSAVAERALLANMGVEDEFGPDFPASRVLNGKGTLNFILEEPTHLKYIDATMALHNAGALRLLSSSDVGGVILPSAEEESALLEVSVRNGTAGEEIAMIL